MITVGRPTLGHIKDTKTSVMPELPEVETVRRTLIPVLRGDDPVLDIREPRLRYPRGKALENGWFDATSIARRGKYLKANGQDESCSSTGVTGVLSLGKIAGTRVHDHAIFELKEKVSIQRRGRLAPSTHFIETSWQVIPDGTSARAK